MDASRGNKYDGVRTYARYFIVGALVGILTILVREAIAAALPSDTPTYYAVSAILAYIIGILTSYVGHRVFSFRHTVPVGRLSTSLGRFSLIAILGLISTTILSLVIRYGLPLEIILEKYEATFAFASATVISSLLTYSLNAKYTFARPETNK